MKTRQRPSGSVAADNPFANTPNPAAAFRAARTHGFHELQVTLRTVTPVYGGSPKAGKPDLLAPFRPRAIRNGVAQWWWLMNRRLFDGPQDLWRAHARAFGGRAGANDGGQGSLVVTQCEVNQASVRLAYWWPFTRNTAGNLVPVNNGPLADAGYALFPARGTLQGASQNDLQLNARLIASAAAAVLWASKSPEIEHGLVRAAQGGRNPILPDATKQHLDLLFQNADGHPALLIEPGASCSLTLRWPRPQAGDGAGELHEQRLRRAIYGWLVLGTIGGRGSRGLGAFEVTASRLDGQALDQNLPYFTCDRLPEILMKPDGSALPAFDWRLKVSAPNTPWRAWLQGLSEYRSFRQFRLLKPHPTAPHMNPAATLPSRSLMPDADAVRRIQQGLMPWAHAPAHPASTQGAGPMLIDITFGAPVRMEFKGVPEPSPTDIGFLYCGQVARFPSPLRTRPVKNSKGEWLSLVVCLPHRQDLAGRSAALGWTPAHRQSPYTLSADVWQRRDPTGNLLPTSKFQDTFGLSALQASMNFPQRFWPATVGRFAKAMVQGAGSGPVAFMAWLHASNEWTKV